MAATPDGGGYRLLGADGGVFDFGDAAYHGSISLQPLPVPSPVPAPLSHRPAVAVVPDRVTGGYQVADAGGQAYPFGAPTLGGTGGQSPSPVVGAAAAPGHGYWLVAADGGVFAFGDAAFAGSLGGHPGSSPTVALVADQVTGGYWLVAASGAVTGFDAPELAPAGGALTGAAVAAAATPDDGGLWLLGAAGGVAARGDATWLGSLDVQVLPLAGKVVALDPGHDGGNAGAPGIIDQPIDGGGFTEPCDTAGTETATGYPEHAFNFDVAQRLAAILRSEGATVVLTRTTDTGVGPCVNVRAAIGNAAHADAAVSIHADGGPVTGSGFDVIEPLPVISSISDNTSIVAPSAALAVDIRNAFQADTGEPPANYVGTDGIDARSDLGGLNLSTVPKVLIECANMRNGGDAANVESASWRQAAAQGLADGITAFLTS